MSMNDFLVFGSPAIGEEEIAEVEACMRSGWLGTGPRVAQFEKKFADYKCISGNAVAAVNSCTAALHLAISAFNFEKDSEIITTPLTFCATINSIIHSGLKPVLVDVDSDTYNIDPLKIEASITPYTRAILVVHFAGRPCNMDAILAIAKKYDLRVIEDCAHAVEALYNNKPIGTFGDFGCFSFYATKNVVTGEGGMVIGKDIDLISRVKILALHGMSKDAWHRFGDQGYKHYQVVEAGFKYNMMDLQAAIGIHQLARVEKNWLRRAEIWDAYIKAFSDLPIILPIAHEHNTRHGYHLFTILIDGNSSTITRDEFLNEMNECQIGTGVHYLSIPEHPYYQEKYGWKPEDYPNAMHIGRQTVSLPLSAKLTDTDIDKIIVNVRNLLINNKNILAK